MFLFFFIINLQHHPPSVISLWYCARLQLGEVSSRGRRQWLLPLDNSVGGQLDLQASLLTGTGAAVLAGCFPEASIDT